MHLKLNVSPSNFYYHTHLIHADGRCHQCHKVCIQLQPSHFISPFLEVGVPKMSRCLGYVEQFFFNIKVESKYTEHTQSKYKTSNMRRNGLRVGAGAITSSVIARRLIGVIATTVPTAQRRRRHRRAAAVAAAAAADNARPRPAPPPRRYRTR